MRFPQTFKDTKHRKIEVAMLRRALGNNVRNK